MASTPAFQFYPRDWLSSTRVRLMTPAERGAYIELLCHMWDDPDCGLEDDDETLAVLSGLGEGWFKGGSEKVRRCFMAHPKKPGFLTSERLLKERKKQEQWREKCRKGGRKSARVRRNKGESGYGPVVKDSARGSSGEAPGALEVRPRISSSSSSSTSEIGERGPSPEILFNLWNRHAEGSAGLIAARELNEERMVRCRARLKERPQAEWEEVIRRVAASTFCNGGNPRGWRASIDWIIANETNAAKVLEGRYDDPVEEGGGAGERKAREEREREAEELKAALLAREGVGGG